MWTYTHALPHQSTRYANMSLTQCKLCVAGARPPLRIHRVYTIYVHCVPLALRPTKPPRPIQCGTDMQLHAIPHLLDRPPNCLRTQCKLSMAGSRLSQRAHWVCAVYARCSHAYHLISTPIWPRRRASGHRSGHVASAAAECSSSARVHGGTRATSICR